MTNERWRTAALIMAIFAFCFGVASMGSTVLFMDPLTGADQVARWIILGAGGIMALLGGVGMVKISREIRAERGRK